MKELNNKNEDKELKIEVNFDKELKITEKSAEEELSFKFVLSEAKQAYQSESMRPFTTSKLGISFGFFSRSRHETTPEEMKAIEKVLNDDKGTQGIQKKLVEILIRYGNLWDSRPESYNHLFTNYFLLCLRRENVDAYRKLIGEAYGIKFVDGAITLFRREFRDTSTIFRDGFKLRNDWPWNRPETRKWIYAHYRNHSDGISFSKKDPPFEYGPYFYTIVLPENHHYLLIDVGESPRHQGSEYTRRKAKALSEVNSMDNIPSKYIKLCWKQENPYTMPSPPVINEGFSNSSGSTKEFMPPRGCY